MFPITPQEGTVQTTDPLTVAVLRLTSPRPFEPDFAAHLARLAEDDKASAVVVAAGYDADDPAVLRDLRARLEA
jgi:hypothetical protein